MATAVAVQFLRGPPCAILQITKQMACHHLSFFVSDMLTIGSLVGVKPICFDSAVEDDDDVDRGGGGSGGGGSGDDDDHDDVVIVVIAIAAATFAASVTNVVIVIRRRPEQDQSGLASRPRVSQLI